MCSCLGGSLSPGNTFVVVDWFLLKPVWVVAAFPMVEVKHAPPKSLRGNVIFNFFFPQFKDMYEIFTWQIILIMINQGEL